MDLADKFNKKYLKFLLAVPVTVANAAIYVLSGTMPVQGTLDQRILNLFGNICRLSDSSIEKQLAKRQPRSLKSYSWFIVVKTFVCEIRIGWLPGSAGEPTNQRSMEEVHQTGG